MTKDEKAAYRAKNSWCPQCGLIREGTPPSVSWHDDPCIDCGYGKDASPDAALTHSRLLTLFHRVGDTLDANGNLDPAKVQVLEADMSARVDERWLRDVVWAWRLARLAMQDEIQGRAALEAAMIERHDKRLAELEAERDHLRAEMERMRPVVTAAQETMARAYYDHDILQWRGFTDTGAEKLDSALDALTGEDAPEDKPHA